MTTESYNAPSSKRHLVITADDLGYSKKRSLGILECHNKGGVSRSSLLVNGENAEEAVLKASKQHLTLGLHLNLTEGLPVSPINKVSSLISGKEFRGKMGFREALSQGMIHHEELKLEIENQIVKFQQLTGQLPKYVDGHQHVHILSGVNTIFAEMLSQHHIFNTRLPVEPAVSSCSWLTEESQLFSKLVVTDAHMSQPIFDAHKIRYPELFVGMCTMGANMTTCRLQEALTKAFKLTAEVPLPSECSTIKCELMTHPGFPSQSEVKGCGLGGDKFDMSPERLHELQILTSVEMKNFYQRHSIVLINGV